MAMLTEVMMSGKKNYCLVFGVRGLVLSVVVHKEVSVNKAVT
jgi:hypothetical protein